MVNLFDFSQNQSKIPAKAGTFQDYISKQNPTPVLNMGAPMSGPGITNFSDYKESIPKTQPTQKPTTPSSGGFSLVPKANANESMFDKYMNDSNISKQGKFKMLQDIQSGNITEQDAEGIISKIYGEVQQTTQLVQEEQGLLQKTGNALSSFRGGIDNTIGGAVSQVPKIAGEVTGFILGKPVDYALKKAGIDTLSLEEAFKEQGLQDKASLQNSLGVDPDAFTTQLGEVGGEIGAMFTPTGGVKVGTKIAEKAPAVIQGLKTLSVKAPATFSAVKTALIGAGQGAKAGVIASGDVTGTDLALGAGLATGLQAGGKLLQKGKQFITKDAPEKLIVSGLVNPSDLKNASERIAKLTGKDLDVTDTSKWLLKNVKQGGDKAFLRNELSGVVTERTKQASTLLKNNTEKFTNETTSNLKQGLKEKLTNFGRFNKNGEFIASAGNQKSADEILGLLSKKGLTLEEINKGRTIISQNIFTKQGTQKDIQSVEGLQNVWKDTSKFIESKAPGFRKINKDIEVGIALGNAISKKEASDLTRQMLAYTGIGGTLGGVSSGGNPEEILKGALVGFGAGKLKEGLTSTTVKTKLATLLNKFNKAEQEQIKSFITTGGGTEISKDLLKKLKLSLPLLNNN